MSSNNRHLYEFGPFRLDPVECQLLRDGAPVPLEPKVLELLIELVRRGGQLARKDELMHAVWPDTFVEEANLTRCVSKLRGALGESEGGRQYIETVPKRGYRFSAEVRRLPATDEELTVEMHSYTRTVTEQEEVWDEPSDLAEPTPTGKRARTRLPLVFALPILLAAGTAVALYFPLISHSYLTGKSDAASTLPFQTLAVLPFDTVGSDSGSEYLGVGLADALITRLSKDRRVVVRPTSAVRRYADGKKDAIEAGTEQGVDAVLSGTVQRYGDHVRVTVQLVSVRDGATLWAERFDEPFKNMLSAQDAIAARVWGEFVTRVRKGDGAQSGRQREVKIEAYEAYLKGRYFWAKRDAEGVRNAVGYFERAVALEPDYAEAYASLGGAYTFGNHFGMSPAEAYARARAITRKALDLDENLPDAHATLGLISLNYDWDWETAGRELERALELSPNSAIFHDWYAEYLNAVGRRDEAQAEIERAREFDPLSVIINSDKGKMLFFARRYEEAIEQCKKTLELEPNFGETQIYLGWSYYFAGDREQAGAAFERLMSGQTGASKLWYQGMIAAMTGRAEQARGIAERLQPFVKAGKTDPAALCQIYLLLGDKDKSLEWLERSYEARSTFLTSIKPTPLLDGLRADPRFADLLRRMGLS